MIPIDLNKDVIINQLIYTSGKGADYRFIAKSVSLKQSVLKKIEKFALIKYYTTPDISFKDALKFFPASEDLYAISYVTIAGKDEYNRPERLRAHILIMESKLLEIIADFRIFKEFFINEDKFGELNKIKMKKIEILKRSSLAMSRLLGRINEVLRLFTNEQLEHLFYAIYNNIKVIVIPSNKIMINSITDTKKISSLDIISTILMLLPFTIKKKLSFSSLILHGDIENINLGFTHERGVLPHKKSLILDLNNGSIDKIGINYKIDSLISELISILLDSLKRNRFNELKSIISLIGASYSLIKKRGKKGAKLVQGIIDWTYDLVRSVS